MLFENISFSIGERQKVGLIAQNGTGKTTLLSMLTGEEGCDSGSIIFRNGIKVGYLRQEPKFPEDASVIEACFHGIDFDDDAQLKAKQILTQLRIKDLNQPISQLSGGQQKRVALAQTLISNPDLLILDEPTASLNDTEAKQLLDLLLELKKQGTTSIIISHKLNEISYVADTITIIRDGGVIKSLDKEKDSFDENTIIAGMVGRSLSDRFPKRTPNIGDVCFEVKDWCVDHPVFDGIKVCRNVNFNIRKGEVVGISGLMGAGRTELAMSIFGKSYGANISGKIFLNGKEVELKNVKSAIAHGIAYVTEDRKGNGLILSETIARNTTSAKLKRIAPHNIIDFGLENKYAQEIRQDMHTKCLTVFDEAGSLSGGNQQKVLIGKWLFAEPEILILDEPTRGIDVGAKYEIYCIINQMVAQGKSILLISSEMPEILGMCDRIYIMNEGTMVGEMAGKDATQEKIMSCIIKSGSEVK